MATKTTNCHSTTERVNTAMELSGEVMVSKTQLLEDLNQRLGKMDSHRYHEAQLTIRQMLDNRKIIRMQGRLN